jgi:hypothetical protein
MLVRFDQENKTNFDTKRYVTFTGSIVRCVIAMRRAIRFTRLRLPIGEGERFARWYGFLIDKLDMHLRR